MPELKFSTIREKSFLMLQICILRLILIRLKNSAGYGEFYLYLTLTLVVRSENISIV